MLIVNEPEIAAHSINVVDKKWGKEFWILNCDKYAMKFLKLMPGFRSSIHSHKKKDETFIGVSGTALLTIHYSNGEPQSRIAIDPGKTHRIAPNTFHSFEAKNVAWLMEISTHHSDSDVMRILESSTL